mmetsp:Transcript_36129/g.95207  ORF Transcript_36129/g.95207 Transcript_36129/m.95207 type:complete len:224 (-) Transcript_36129:133-804(-)
MLSATFATVSATFATVVATCKPVMTQPDFNLTEFVDGGKKWFIHQQMAIQYLPAEENYCVTAEYHFKDEANVKVHNYANKDHVNGEVYDSDVQLAKLGGICGTAVNSTELSKLSVGPCALPEKVPYSHGPYWIVAAGPKSSDYEWALVSGGQPTIPGATEGTCKTGTGVNGSGLWIFLRSALRDEDAIQMVRQIAAEKGFDLTVLADVDQEGCLYQPARVHGP